MPIVNRQSPIAISNRQSPVQFQISNRQSPIASLLSVSPSITSCDSSSGNTPLSVSPSITNCDSLSRPTSIRSHSEPVPVSVPKETSNTMDDPFVVLESASPPVTSSQVPSFIDPLETVHKINISKSTKTATSSKGVLLLLTRITTGKMNTQKRVLLAIIRSIILSITSDIRSPHNSL